MHAIIFVYFNKNNNMAEDDYMPIVYAVRSLITFYALFISFRCNKGFTFGGFLGALFFSEIYIVYKYATQSSCFRSPRSRSKSTRKKSKKKRRS